ncbi:putative glycerol kinase [Ditylenchus destructor]|uniref:Probable glycerol kinase n=1 Tax=Ditylenchus destructor TaxID=166010 RepID=A0AAD4N174_9BILA|nr:putative glycerol kinase [Ditylenchus destructor]
MVLLGAIDQGTSSSRFLVFESDSGELVAYHQIAVEEKTPQPGWVEMCPEQLYTTTMDCIEEVCRSFPSAKNIKAIGIANQRETTVAWDKSTGKALYNAILWLDSRTSDLASEYIKKTPTKNKDYFKAKTGLPIHPYFSALKLNWLLNNIEGVKRAKENGNLLFGTVDSWLLWHMTGGAVHVCDVSNASRTLLMDLGKRRWSTELCDFFDIPIEILPEIKSSAEIYGILNAGSLKGMPISGCLCDQQAAMVGHCCFRRGECKATYGTGTFFLCNTGKEPIFSQNGMLTTIVYQFGKEGGICYALEGSGSIGGNVIHFLRDNLKFIKECKEIDELAGSVDHTDGVYFVPSFTGLFSPYWDSTARGIICGLTLGTTQGHIALAALKSIAFEIAEMVEFVQKDLKNTDIRLGTLKIDGGLTVSQIFDQVQADVLGSSIVNSTMTEVSGWGAAIAAGIGAGQFTLEEFSQRQPPKRREFCPKSTEKERMEQYKKWKEAVQRAKNWSVSEH